MVYKGCVVPCCKNNTCDTPNKIFLSIPFSLERQNEWARALKLSKLPTSKDRRHCCEDHFDVSTFRTFIK